MPYLDDDGRLNNFAIEPEVYQSQPQSKQEKNNLLILTLGGLLLVGLLVGVSFVIS